jgi:hypothetical protein
MQKSLFLIPTIMSSVQNNTSLPTSLEFHISTGIHTNVYYCPDHSLPHHGRNELVRHVVHVSAAAGRNGANGLNVRQRHRALEEGRQHHGQQLAGPELENLAEAEERPVAGRIVLME